VSRFPRAAPSIAFAILVLFVLAQALDIRMWNKTCGAEARKYDVWAQLIGDGGLQLHVPFLLISLLALIIPVLLVQSQLARVTTTVFMSILLLLCALFSFPAAINDYNDECYRGGHENSPGEGLILFIVPGLMVSILNTGVLLIDSTVRIIKSLLNQNQPLS
jgi:hypothetical protein